jgi:hypothetical protein
MSARDLLGFDILILGGVPLFQELWLDIGHALFAPVLKPLAILALHAPDSVVDGSRPPMAPFAQPPHGLS